MPHRGLSYFILDDDDAFSEDLAEALVHRGHRVRTAGDPQFVSDEALNDADVLLLDLALPTVDGIGVLARLRHLAHPPRIVFISGSGEELLRTASIIARSHGLRVLGTLGKPFGPEDVTSLAEPPAPAFPGAACQAECPAERLLPALRDAVKARTLPVLFQPLLTTQHLLFAGAEALLGNQLPGFGPVTPQEMVRAASTDIDVLRDLTVFVLEQAVDACARLSDLQGTTQVSINLPLEVLETEGAVETISHIVARGGVAPRQIILELTEDAIYFTSPQALAAIAQLRLAGFGVALDDVAQRQSGLLQLSNLPVTEIKIDLELLRQARQWDKARWIFTSIADLGHRLGLTVVAEGVESLDDLALARRASVDYIQGYLVSRKRPLSELLAMQTMLGSTCEPWVEPLQGVA
ncbi:MAG: EAL domain-containing response regulator [Rhizobiales bacterium]|nr:EAL domain-containing response regulator [Hyphomicrobiales bacterium]